MNPTRRILLKVLRQAAILIFTLVLSGFLACVMLRYSPGFGVDEKDLDSRYKSETLNALHQARKGEINVVQFYFRYLNGIAHGDLGISPTFELPIGELIAARAPITVRLVSVGLLCGWLLGVGLAVVSTLRPSGMVLIFSELASGLFLCFPAAVVALFVFIANGPVPLVISVAIFPRVYRYARVLLLDALAQPCVLSAAGRGIPAARIFFRYAVPPVVAPLAAFLGVCVTLAFGAALPVEVICDLPGIGHLAWKAALSHDTALLAAMTLLVTAVTLISNAAADLAFAGPRA